MPFRTCLYVLPPPHCSGGILVAATWRTVLVGVLACRLFGDPQTTQRVASDDSFRTGIPGWTSGHR
jgi:hypothetical protein